MNVRPQISVIIVNYNVKEYLEQALNSLKRALKAIPHEIVVVDNASVDGSAAYIRSRFPDVRLIANKENLGFARANNIALKQVAGEYVVLINPDTVVQEDTFSTLLKFFQDTPDASAATCKIINPDGSFSVDCRHSIPTPMIAFWKVTGLSRLFPKSKLFGKYNLTYLDPDQTYPVPAISGSFMMIKKQVLDAVGYFDEQFFMYCEDIDLCHRINQAGFKIYYVPKTQIIHYKGESTKKNNLDYVVTFNKSLYLFFKKYYAQGYIFLFRWIIVLGIVLRGMFVFVKNFIQNHFPLLVDLAILNLVVLGSFVLRFQFRTGFYWENFFNQYWIINLISSLLFLGVAYNLEVYPKHRLSIQSIIKANAVTFILLASLTFFLKQFAFSRMVVLMAGIASPLLMIMWRAVLRRFYRGERALWGRDFFSKPTVIVGDGQAIVDLYSKIRSMNDLSYDLRGVIVQNQEAIHSARIPVLGDLENIKEILRINGIRQIVFSSQNLTYEQILKTMTQIGQPWIEYKIVPSNLEVMIGKSHIEKMEDYPFLEIDYAVGKVFNRTLKRGFDIALSGVLVLLTVPMLIPLLIVKGNEIETVSIVSEKGGTVDILHNPRVSTEHLLNRMLLLVEIFRGKLSFVGAPITRFASPVNSREVLYKPGITGLVQINREKIAVEEDAEKFHLFYLKNQSLLLDLEILTKAVFSKKLFSLHTLRDKR